MTLNELVKLTTLWTTGPWSLNADAQADLYAAHFTISFIYLYMFVV